MKMLPCYGNVTLVETPAWIGVYLRTRFVSYVHRYLSLSLFRAAAFARYLLDIVSLYAEPVREAGKPPKYSSCTFSATYSLSIEHAS